MNQQIAHRNPWIALVIAVLLTVASGCEDSLDQPQQEEPDPNNPQAGDFLHSDKQRDTTPQVEDEDLTALVEGNSRFAVDLYRLLGEEQDGNLFFSPHSISVALAMTYAGAEGQTETEMAETLHFTLEESRLHPAFNALDLELNSRGEQSEQDGTEFRLRVVNALWGQIDYGFLAGFLDLLAENYGAGIHLVDFVNATEEARQIINDWVAEQTEDRIQDLLGPNAISTLTRLVLTNAIYFKAGWSLVFDEDATSQGTFHCLDGNEVSVPMMHLFEGIGFVEGEGYSAAELLYKGEELSMVLIVPDAGQFEAFEADLSAELLDEIVGGLEITPVALGLPKFDFASEFELGDALKALGMPTAFDALADFSGMDGTHNLFISRVIHKAFIAVDEHGTEAAAATAVVMDFGAMPYELQVDRPFFFLIRDVQTGAILFMGRVVNPTA
ncbi:MAG: serpin family protein [Bradymonadales bacterium]|nr:serpin family protein [Bradymonadales bacterium]